MYQQDPDSMVAVAPNRGSRFAAEADAAADKYLIKPAASLTGEIIQRNTPGPAVPDVPVETPREAGVKPEADAGKLDVPSWRPDASRRVLDDDWEGPADSACGESWWRALGLPRWSDLMVFLFGYLLFLIALVFGMNILPGFAL